MGFRGFLSIMHDKILQEFRNKIDAIDNNLLLLLNERMQIVKKIGDLKKQNQTAIYRPEREKQILARLSEQNSQTEGLLNDLAIDAIFMEIFAASRNLELPERVSYLGPEGSFTHQAAESKFGFMSDYIPLKSIRDVFQSVNTERVRFGIVPIENNQEGFVDETIDLLDEMDVQIVAEIIMPIHHTFVSKCEKLSDIKYIYSKDIAFKQCRNFLANYFKDSSAEFISVESTSKASKIASEEENSGAICANVAAKLFKVPILFENIEDNPNNKTRFYVLAKNFQNNISGEDKTILIAKLANKAGSLANFLQDFNEFQVNMTKIESRPSRNNEQFNSWFYIEIEGHQQETHLQNIIARHQSQLKVLGSIVKW